LEIPTTVLQKFVISSMQILWVATEGLCDLALQSLVCMSLPNTQVSLMTDREMHKTAKKY